MYQLSFINQDQIIQVDGGTLANACAQIGYSLNLVCGGKGTCNKCLVTIESKGNKRQELACQYQITEDLTVFLDSDQINDQGLLLSNHLTSQMTHLDPAISKSFQQELAPESYHHFLKTASIPLLQKFSNLIHDPETDGFTTIYHQDKIIDFQKNDTSQHLYGGAVDIGTTSVVLYVYDLIAGKLLFTESALNRQISFGADVITRILACQEDPDALNALNQCIFETINKLLTSCFSKNPDLQDNFYQLVVCGNSTMQHLFFKLNPTALGVFPYANIFENRILTDNWDCGLKLPQTAIIDFLPLLGGFVGADTTSVLMTLPQDNKNYLMIDLDTNGEIAVGNTNQFYTASTACGPALEGANIECGMRACDGAIDKIWLTDTGIDFSVIGNCDPIGLCGSAIIDAVAVLRSFGIIDASGYLLSPAEYGKLYPAHPLLSQLFVTESDDVVFYFSRGQKPVYISQADIRQIQLAKSSIFSGCMTLLKECQLSLDDIDELVLAGAFGNFINIENALAIGLLPNIPVHKRLSIGNGAGLGVQLCLLNQSEMLRTDALQTHCQQVKLADSADFMEAYIMNMNFN